MVSFGPPCEDLERESIECRLPAMCVRTSLNNARAQRRSKLFPIMYLLHLYIIAILAIDPCMVQRHGACNGSSCALVAEREAGSFPWTRKQMSSRIIALIE